MRPAIFLDRDGVINANRADHVKCWEEFEFLPGAVDAIRMLGKLGHPIVVVTNQGAIGRGLTSFEAVDEIHARMIIAIEEAGACITEVRYCPHRPEDQCACRKPQAGMLLEAAQAHEIDLTQSVFIGDAQTDIVAGQSVGCRMIMVMTGRGRSELAAMKRAGADLSEVTVVEDLMDAAALVVEQLTGASEAVLMAHAK